MSIINYDKIFDDIGLTSKKYSDYKFIKKLPAKPRE